MAGERTERGCLFKNRRGLCDNGDYDGSAPRDCAMLLVIPDLASADELATDTRR